MAVSDDHAVRRASRRAFGLPTLLRQPSTALLLAAFVLPALLFGLAAWSSYREALSQAEARVERTTRLLDEHAVKVFETDRLVTEQVRQRIETIDWSSSKDRDDLQALLQQLQNEIDQVTTITVTDANGHMLASGRLFPADPKISFADRDWFQELKRDPMKPAIISKAYIGRQSRMSVFNLAIPILDEAGVFNGVIAVSIDRSYFEDFYKGVEPQFDHAVTLVRSDGEILASEPATPLQRIPADWRFMKAIRKAPVGSFVLTSRIDHVDRIYAYRKVGSYPIYVRFGISVNSALASWRQNLFVYGIVAALVSVTLAVVSLFAIRQTWRERDASRRWRDTAAELKAQAAERERVEDQLRHLQKMEAIGRLTGGIAHDFNNLLTVVTGNLELTQRVLESSNPRAIRHIAHAMEGATRASALTHRLLAFSRQQPLQPKQIDLDQLVAGMSELLRVTVGEMVALKIVAVETTWPISVDPNQLENVLLNLAVNARDAMPSGGGLTIETSNVRLDEDYAATQADITAGPFVLLAVADSGSGIAPDLLAKVFEPFFTTKPVGKGTGLGLSQVYGFAKQSGGHVAIYSEVGQGTTVKLYLPKLMRVEQQKSAPPIEVRTTGPARGETILVVEDEDIVRQFSVAALTDAGYRVLEADDGAAALGLLRLHPEIALLFTDVVLKGPMNGRMLVDAALVTRSTLPVLFTTGYTRDAIVHDGHIDEGLNFLGKPFSAADLASKVRELLDAATAQAAAAVG